VTTSALGERAAYAALYWARRRDADAIRAVVAGLDDAAKATAAALLSSDELEVLSDAELLERMLELGAKSRGTEHKILAAAEVKSVATITAGPAADTGSGSFTGYLAAFGRDHQGDTIQPGAMDSCAAALNSGRIQWLLTDSHSERAADVVATVTAAVIDHLGLRIQGQWMPDEAAQKLRAKVRNGAKLGLSIDYLTGASRPDGKGGRLLDAITIVGGAVTPHPMNAAATIIESKYAATVPVMDVYADAQERRRDPGRDQAEAEDAVLASVSWPPPGLFDRKTSLALIRGAAAADARRELAGDPVAAREQAIRDQDNAYSSGLAAWMAANR
jgi:Caudovirus prohead serine protease